MNAKKQRVVITGTGALSALGDSPEALWRGLLAARSGIRRVPRFVDAGLPVTTGGDIESVPHDLPDRDQAIACRARDQALAEANLPPEKAGFLWATGLDTFQFCANGFEHRSAGSCFNALARPFRNPRRMVATACASSTQTIGEAFRLIRAGRSNACVAGGSSVILTPFYLIGFAALQVIAADQPGTDPAAACRPFDRRRRGFVLADGAGALVLESLTSAQQRGRAVLGEVLGFGTSQDAFDLNRPPEDGAGAERCMRRALDDAGLMPSALDAVNAHGTGTYVGDPAETAALRRVLGDAWRHTPVSSSKGALGHPMAASGALEAIVALRTCATGIVPPTVNLQDPDVDCELDHVIGHPRHTEARTVMSISFGMGGQNAAVIFRRWEE